MAANRPLHARARAAVLPLPHRAAAADSGCDGGAERARTRALGVLALLLAATAAAYTLARTTSMFAIERIELRGAPTAVRAPVQATLARWLGTSLVGLDTAELRRRVATVPWVEQVALDRAFPNALRVAIRPERPVAVLRRGREWWLVSARGRVLQRLPPRAEPGLPRIWVARAARVRAGDMLAAAGGGAAARALAPLLRATFPVPVTTAALRRGELVFRLRSDVELRLGRPRDLRLKLAIVRRIVATLPGDVAYLDVSVPERPVAGSPSPSPTDAQVSG